MGLTGKYNFPGIQAAGEAGIKAALASTSWGAAFLASVFFKIFAPAGDALLDEAVNWLANQGLIVLDLGAIVVNGAVDQSLFDQAMDAGITKVEQGRDKITAAQGKAIDDAVIKAARNFIRFNPNANSVPNNEPPGFQSGRDITV